MRVSVKRVPSRIGSDLRRSLSFGRAASHVSGTERKKVMGVVGSVRTGPGRAVMCAVSTKEFGKLAHGKVTGEIPEEKLKEFLAAEAKARRGGETSGRGRVARAGFHLGGGQSDLE